MVLEFITTMLMPWLIPFIVAAVVLMISSGIFDYRDLSPVRSLVIAFFAIILPFILLRFFGSYVSFIYILPFGNIILSLACWIILVMLISDADWEDKLKIAVLGFTATQIILFILPYFGIF